MFCPDIGCKCEIIDIIIINLTKKILRSQKVDWPHCQLVPLVVKPQGRAAAGDCGLGRRVVPMGSNKRRRINLYVVRDIGLVIGLI